MSIILRVILIISSFIAFFLCVKKIRQAKIKISNSLIWLSGSILLIFISIFSEIPIKISEQLGFISPVNFIFLFFIAFLLIQSFMDNMRLTELSEKIKELNHYIALKEKELYDEKVKNKEQK